MRIQYLAPYCQKAVQTQQEKLILWGLKYLIDKTKEGGGVGN